MPIVLDPDKQLIAIDTYYIEEQKKRGNFVFHFIRSQEEFNTWQNKGYIPEDKIVPGQNPEKIIRKLITYWKTMSWKDQNNILSKTLRHTTKPDGTVMTNLDPIHYRDLKLKTCLKKWNVLNENNSPMEVTEKAIDNLHPQVAQELLDSFERVTEASEEDLGN